MAPAMTREKGYVAAFEFAQYERVGGITEGSFDTHFVLVGEAGHGVQPAAANDADFCLSQAMPLAESVRVRAAPPGRVARLPIATNISV